MSAYRIMLKANIKLLLRNKGFLALVIILPLISVFLLNIRMDGASEDYYEVYELAEDQQNIMNFEVDFKMVIKVYDGQNTEASKYYLDMLSQSGMYRIYRYDASSMSASEIKESAMISADGSSLHAILYIPADFIEHNSVTIYPIGEDDRQPILEDHLIQNMRIMKQYSNEQRDINLEVLQQQVVNKQIVTVEISDSTLTAIQQQQQANIGFSLATVVLGFVFTGVCITAIINYEKNHQVLTRMLMIPSVNRKYVVVKAIITLLTVSIQCLLLLFYFTVFGNMDLGISIFQYIGLIFGIGIIFNLLSVMIGIFIPNLLTTSYIAFFLWAITNMLSGTYFPGITLPDIWEKIGLLMPQKWLLSTSEALLTNKMNAVFTYGIVIIGFTFIIITIGFLGIKLNEQE